MPGASAGSVVAASTRCGVDPLEVLGALKQIAQVRGGGGGVLVTTSRRIRCVVLQWKWCTTMYFAQCQPQCSSIMSSHPFLHTTVGRPQDVLGTYLLAAPQPAGICRCTTRLLKVPFPDSVITDDTVSNSRSACSTTSTVTAEHMACDSVRLLRFFGVEDALSVCVAQSVVAILSGLSFSFKHGMRHGSDHHALLTCVGAEQPVTPSQPGWLFVPQGICLLPPSLPITSDCTGAA